MKVSDEPNKHLNFSLDLRWVIALLVVAIAGMLLIWKPWSGSTTEDRTIQVTGETTLRATPDAFVFHPTYQEKNADTEKALKALTQKTEAITTELKKLGVEEKHIEVNASGYDSLRTGMPEDESSTYTSQLTITVTNEELAQKVQDYLLTTKPTGSVTPTPTFSDAKRKELEAQARDEATKDARAKADQTAKNLGFKVGKVKSISDGSGMIVPFSRGEATTLDMKSASLTLHPGENELPYSLTVVYYIR